MLPIGCKNTLDSQELTLKEESVELNWIKERPDNGWYLEGYQDMINDRKQKYKCESIVLYPTKLLFIYEMNGNKMIKEINAVYNGEEGWI